MDAEAAPAEEAPASDFEEIGEKEVEAANEAAAEAKQEEAIEKEEEKPEEEVSQEPAPEEHTPKRPDLSDEEPAEAEETMEAEVAVDPEEDQLTLGVEHDDLSEEQAEEKAVNLNSAKVAKIPEAYTDADKPAEETAKTSAENSSPKKSPKKMTKAEKKKMWQEKRKENAAKKREERMKKAAEAKEAAAASAAPLERKNGIWICGLQKSVKAMTIKEFLIKNEIKGTVLALKVALRRATQESFAYIELKDKPDHELALKVFTETTELGKITVERVDSDPTIKKASPAKPAQKRTSDAANNKASNGLMPKRQKIAGESEEPAAKQVSFQEPAKPMAQTPATDAQLEAKVTKVKVTFLAFERGKFIFRVKLSRRRRLFSTSRLVLLKPRTSSTMFAASKRIALANVSFFAFFMV